jgi:two-component system OmpR family sensor kinase
MAAGNGPDSGGRLTRRVPRGAWRSARFRVLASYVVLLVLAGVVSMVGIGELLVIRLEDRTRDALDQEVLELRELLADRPDTRGEARRTFDVYLDRNVPSEDEALLFFADGRPYRSELSRFPLDRPPREVMDAWARHSLSPPPEGRVVEGDFDTPLGRGHYSAVPAGSSGVFVVAILPASELREIDELQSAGFVVLAVIVLLASLLASMATQRAFRPLRALSEAATSISDSDLSRRLPVRGGTEEVEMARAFNSMLDRLEEVVRTQRDFLRRASHELRCR